MPILRANNCDFYYEVRGSGQPILFLHGQTHSLDLFPAQFAEFSKTNFCVAYDRRGHARSESAPYGYSVWNQAHDLGTVLDVLGLDKVIIVAVAMSTTIAVTYALQNPERVAGLVLSSWYELDGFPALGQRRRGISFVDLHLTMYEVMLRHGRSGLEAYLAENHEKILPIFPKNNPEVTKKLIQIFAAHPPAHYLQTGDFYTSIPQLRLKLADLRCPIMGVCGEDDPSPDDPSLLGPMPNFSQKWIPEARRFSMLERPVEFNNALRGFLDELAVNRRRSG